MAKLPQRKISFYIDSDLNERMRSTLLRTMASEGHRSLSEFVSRAVLYEIVRLEARHNGGASFTRVEDAQIPRGRPLG